MRTSSLLLVIGLALVFPHVARADGPATVDIVQMKDGTRLTGSIVELKRGVYVIIDVGDGKPTKVPWAKVKDVLRDQPPPPPPPPPSAAPVQSFPESSAAGPDVVFLKNGQQVSGTVVQQQPGEFVIIRTADGHTHTINWDEIKDVRVTSSSAAAVPTPTPSPAPAPPPPVPAPGAPANGTQETRIDLQNGAPKASYHSEIDCKDPANEKCKQTTNVDLSKGGLTASYKQETVTRVKEPGSSAVNFALDIGGGTILGLGGGGGGGSSVSILMLTTDIKIKILAGSTFPGPEGGSWNGIALEPSAALLTVFVSAPDGTGSSSSTTTWGFQAGGSLGYQFMTFGAMDPDSLKQSGFGLQIGGYAGATGISTPGGADGSSSKVTTNASYGPELGFTFPSYNAGTAEYSSFSITGFVLPTGDGSTFISGSLGWIF